jgi:hypothetical protein
MAEAQPATKDGIAGEKLMEENDRSKDQGSAWTPQILIQAFKEIVTALLGILVVVATIIIAANALGYVGKEQQMSDAKDVLLLMLGLAGVVVGYYFGRVPADARASEAQQQANAATSQAEQVSTQAEIVAAQVDDVIDRVAPAAAAARGAGASAVDPAVVADLKRLRDELRILGNAARGR